MHRSLRNLLICLAILLTGAGSALAEGGVQIRPYVGIRAGKSLFTRPKSGGVMLQRNHPEAHVSGNFGMTIGKYFAIEGVIDWAETEVQGAGIGKVVELGMWTFSINGRLRYPLMNRKLEPYLLAGLGVTFSELNDRAVLNARFLSITGSRDTSFVAILGVGVDYRLTANLSLTAEVKYHFFPNTDLIVAGTKTSVDLDALYYSVGFRVFLDQTAKEKSTSGPPRDRGDKTTWYIALRGGSAFFTDRKSAGVNLTGTNLGGSAAIGVNLGKYWGVAFALDATETDVNAPGFGRVGEYAMWAITAQLRLRYPLMNDRLVPYAVVGAGIGFGEFNDRRVPFTTFAISGRDLSFVGTAGIGVEYFINKNVAIGVEAKYLYKFDNEVTIGGVSRDMSLDSLFVTGGIRIYF